MSIKKCKYLVYFYLRACIIVLDQEAKGETQMQVTLNTRLEYDLRVRLDAQVAKEERPLAKVVGEAIEKYIDEKESLK